VSAFFTKAKKGKPGQDDDNTTCSYCKNKGHKKADCRKLKKKQEQQKPAEASETASAASSDSDLSSSTTVIAGIARTNHGSTDSTTVRLFHAVAIPRRSTIKARLHTAHDVPLIPTRMHAEAEPPPAMTQDATRTPATTLAKTAHTMALDIFSDKSDDDSPQAALITGRHQSLNTRADAAFIHVFSDVCRKPTTHSRQERPLLIHDMALSPVAPTFSSPPSPDTFTYITAYQDKFRTLDQMGVNMVAPCPTDVNLLGHTKVEGFALDIKHSQCASGTFTHPDIAHSLTPLSRHPPVVFPTNKASWFGQCFTDFCQSIPSSISIHIGHKSITNIVFNYAPITDDEKGFAPCELREGVGGSAITHSAQWVLRWGAPIVSSS
jgi:hypothetical protein